MAGRFGAWDTIRQLVGKAWTWVAAQTFNGLLIGAWDGQAALVGGGALVVDGDLEVIDATTLGSESLNEVGFATHADWDVTGDFDDSGGNAAYTHSAGSGTLTQTSANMAIAGVGSRWYKFVYAVASVVAGCSGTITSAFALAAQTLDLSAGTHTLYFKSAASPGNFVISVTSTAGGFTLDNLTLKEIQGGDVTVYGKLLGGGALGLKVYASGIVVIDKTGQDAFQVGTGGNADASLSVNGIAMYGYHHTYTTPPGVASALMQAGLARILEFRINSDTFGAGLLVAYTDISGAWYIPSEGTTGSIIIGSGTNANMHINVGGGGAGSGWARLGYLYDGTGKSQRAYLEGNSTIGLQLAVNGATYGAGTVVFDAGPDAKPAVPSLDVADQSSLGAEKCGNTVFTTGWTVPAGWAVAGGVATHTGGGGVGALELDVSAVAGEFYLVKITMGSGSVGSVTPQVGGVNGELINFNQNGPVIYQRIRATGTGNLKYTPTNDFAGSVTLPSVKKITAGAARAIGGFASPYNVVAYGANITIDCSQGVNNQITLTGNTSITFTNVPDGGEMSLRLIQDGTGSRLVTAWNSTINAPGGVAPTLSSGANDVDVLTFRGNRSGVAELIGQALDQGVIA